MSDPRFIDWSSGEDVTEKIICVTPTTEKRHLERRASDVSDRRKADKLDQLVIDARFNLAFWMKLWNAHPELEATQTRAFYEGQISAWKNILFYAEPKCELEIIRSNHAD